MVYQYNDNAKKPTTNNPSLFKNDENIPLHARESEVKTVNYNEVLPPEENQDSNEILNFDQKDDMINEINDNSNDQEKIEREENESKLAPIDIGFITTFPSVSSSSPKVIDDKENVPFLGVDNPWFGSHEHGNNSDPLGLEWPADYDNHTVNSCSYREFKNLTVFSHAEFIHDYLDFRHCIGKTSLDDWVKSNLIAETGSMGQMLIRTNIEFSRHPDTDPNGVNCNDEKVKVIIVSISQSRQEREIIRSTWAKNLTQSVKLVFITSRNSDSHEVEKDVIETNIDSQDPYFEFKQTIAMFSWLDKNCPRVRFVLKTCSDIFINTNKLIELADQEMYASNRMYGDLLRRIGAERKKESKQHHPVSLEEWPWRKFPPFLKGPSYIISGDLIPRILMATTVIPALPLAQIYFTGLVPLLGHMMRIGVSSFFAYSPPPKNTTDPCDYAKFGGIHQISDFQEMQFALNKAEEAHAQNQTCQVAPRCLVLVEGKCGMYSKDLNGNKKPNKPAFKWP